MNRGRLVALEGLDGCGKSTQLPRLAMALRRDGHEVVETREPTDGRVGQRIRAMARSGKAVAPEQELAWFFEDRREHVARVIEPALAAGRWVLTDRYFLSTVAYQGARGLDWQAILADSEAEFPAPDVALYFTLPVEDGLARTRTRGGSAEPVFEQAGFLTRVAEVFAAIDRPWWVPVAAEGTIEEVTARALSALRDALGVC